MMIRAPSASKRCYSNKTHLNMAADDLRTARGLPELHKRKLKEQVVDFYTKHNVTGVLEKLLNTMYLDSPADVYGYMSDYFHRLSLDPTISKLVVFNECDSEGEKALAVSVYCTVHGEEKFVNTTRWPMPPNPKISEKPIQEKNVKSSKDKSPVKTAPVSPPPVEAEQPPLFIAAHESVSEHIAFAVKGHIVKNQQGIDNIMCEIKRHPALNPSALTTVSVAIAQAAATLLDSPLFVHLANTLKTSHSRFSLPLPISTVVAGGQLGCGKLKVRGFCLSSLPSCNVQEQVMNITNTYREIGRVLGGVVSGCRLPVSGAYCVPTDKVEQVLDLVKKAIENIGLQLNGDVSIFIDVGAEWFYDEDKNKYEVVTGQWKTCDEMIALYSSWLASYPGILGLIDPLHPKDKMGWQKITDVLRNKCLLIADRTLSDVLSMESETLKLAAEENTSEQESVKDAQQSVPSLSMFNCATITTETRVLSDVFVEAGKMMDHINYLVLQTSSWSHTADSLCVLADLGVALQCKFIRCGAPVGATSTVLLSRLSQIRAELCARSIYEPSAALQFSPSHSHIQVKE